VLKFLKMSEIISCGMDNMNFKGSGDDLIYVDFHVSADFM
jgi:hypothetical protein